MKRAGWALPALLLAAPAHAQQPVPDDVYRQAVAARQQGDARRAAELLTPLAAANPANADVQVQLGYALLALDRLDDAERAFRAALAVAPDYGDARLGLARIAQRRGDRARAVRELAALDPSNPEARTLRAQLTAGATGTRWSLALDGSYSVLRGRQPDWREGSIFLRYQATDATGVSARVEAASRFDNTDVYGEIGVDHALSDRARVYVTLGGTPDADFRPRYQVGAGISYRITDGGSATVLTLDARQAQFATGDVQSATPGIEQYLAGGRIWLTARWINLFDRTGRHQSGYLARADGQLTERLRLFAGWSDAPDTSEGIVVGTLSYFGGASYDLDARTTLRLSVAHEDRDTGSDRTQFGLGLGLRF